MDIMKSGNKPGFPGTQGFYLPRSELFGAYEYSRKLTIERSA